MWALIFCYTRMYLGVHYPSDIFCGALLGLVCGSMVLLLYRLGGRIRKRQIDNQ